MRQLIQRVCQFGGRLQISSYQFAVSRLGTAKYRLSRRQRF